MGDGERLGRSTSNSAWHSEMFDELADEWNEIVTALDHRPAIQFVKRLLNEAPEGELLDLCCGQGRLLPDLSLFGRRVLGVDASARQLSRASRNSGSLSNVSLLQLDMRELPLEGFGHPVAVALRCYTSLGYFTDVEEREILARLLFSAAPAGFVVLDTFNWDWVVAKGPIRRVTRLPGFNLTEHYWADEPDGTIRSDWRYDYLAGAPSRSIHFSLAAYDIARASSLLKSAGWKAPRIFAGYTLVEAIKEPEPPERLVIVAQAP